MNAQVLYRKWRPQRLEEVVGQPTVTQTLRYALATGRVAHAYLFCGPRGTGKTSTARIIAKAMNCLDLQEGEPCNRCALCREVDQGGALDIIEMDAASNRGIDEIRDLRERVQYAPTQGRYKTYIIDEVHQLTEAAANALLKTLEEPPPHVIFVLATTDPQKVPATIISRCQRFDFRRLSQVDVVRRLQQICDGEGAKAEPGALEVIARNAWGSLRDATNILEQAVISYGSPLQAAQVRELLGLSDDEVALQVAAFALGGDVGRGLAALNAAASQGVDLRRFHRNLVEYLRAVLLVKAQAPETLDYPEPIREEVARLAQAHPLARIYQVLRAFANAIPRQDSPSPLTLELALVESSLPQGEVVVSTQEPSRPLPVGAAPAKTAEPPRKLKLDSPPGPLPVEAPPTTEARPSIQAPEAKPVELERKVSAHAENVSGPLPAGQWEVLVKSLRGQRGTRFALDGLLRSAKSQKREDTLLVVEYTSRSNMQRLQQELADPEVRERVAQAVQQAFGASLEVRPILLQQEDAPPSGHLVRAAQRLGGRLIGEEELSPKG